MDFDVRKIAALAALDINDADISRFQCDMEEIANMVSELPELDGETPIPDAMELRSDCVQSYPADRSELMKNAPKAVNGCFAVPRTVEY